MNKVCSKIYYEISTGNVLIITAESQGDIENTTKEQDISIYPQLKDKTIDEINYIELEYGTLISTFNNVKSYSVNLETEKLEVTYYTQVE